METETGKGEDYRDVFTYTNFRRNMAENQEMRVEISEMKGELLDVKEENRELK